MEKDPRVRLIVQEKREGKPAAVNLFLQAATEDICVLESGDTLPRCDSIEKLVAPFRRSDSVGMTGAQKIPVNTPSDVIGYLSHLRLHMEHELCLEIPRLGELIAFRKVLERIPPDVAMDEAFVEALVIQRGLRGALCAGRRGLQHGPDQGRRLHPPAAAQLRRPPASHAASTATRSPAWTTRAC